MRKAISTIAALGISAVLFSSGCKTTNEYRIRQEITINNYNIETNRITPERHYRKERTGIKCLE